MGNLFAAAASKGYENWSLTIEPTFSVAHSSQATLSRFGHQLLLVVLRVFCGYIPKRGGTDSTAETVIVRNCVETVCSAATSLRLLPAYTAFILLPTQHSSAFSRSAATIGVRF